MSRPLLAWLFATLCFTSFLLFTAITASLENVSIDDSDEDNTYRKNRRKKPHIVIIVVDDMDWNDVSFHGSNQISTPNIDVLAYNGILNNHYISPLCTPSITSLMTGKYPIRLSMQHGVLLSSEPRRLLMNEKLLWQVCESSHCTYINDNCILIKRFVLLQYLKEAGYKTTHIVGKWHSDFYTHEYTSAYRGFDMHFSYWNGQDYYNHNVMDPKTLISSIDMRRNMSVAWDTIDKYSMDLFTEEAIRLINIHNKDNPMFLYMAHLAPDSGNMNEGNFFVFNIMIKYFILFLDVSLSTAMIFKLDQSVGEVVEVLKNRGMLENSIILFMSDNGAPTEDIFQNYDSNYLLRDIKGSSLWEGVQGAVQGVAAIWSLLIEKRERVSNQLTYIIDWLFTLLSAAGYVNKTKSNKVFVIGINKKEIPKIDDHDIWTALVSDARKTSSRYAVLINIDDIYDYAAIRHGTFKYINGKSELHSAWIVDSGRSNVEQRSPYDPDQVLQSRAGITIAWMQTIRHVLERKREKAALNQIVCQILQLRREAQIHCNVTEQDKTPCDPTISPCVFNIEEDDRLSMVPVSNANFDPQANSKFWNNTWTC
ncbi:Arylsulfatase B [Ooceraea biroi]|uniref:Arylsulfatase B n=2 Tax=Ooceraea biroi TaxID=2015173 RepID=A0A026WDZ0_OOCBI|nr:Arylsulfatase B [Ooceraea biroi]